MGRSTPNHRKGGREVTDASVGSPRSRPHATTTYGVYLRDLSHERTRSHGIVNYALGLMSALPDALRPDERLLLLANSEIAPALPRHPSAVVDAAAPPPRRAARLYEDHVGGVRAARAAEVALLHFPKGFVPLVNAPRLPLVATLHDDIPLQYWEGAWGRQHRSAGTAYFAWSVAHAARRAAALVTVSEFTRTRLVRRWPHCDPVVAGQGVALPETPFVPLSQRAAVAVHFGSPLPHKASAHGLGQLLRWVDEHPDTGVDEVLVIGHVPEAVAAHPRIRRLEGVRSNAEVADLVAHARLLLFPSLYEGFGLPPLEAALLGTPVAFARIPATEEVLGTGVVGGYDPVRADSFAEAVRGALQLDDAALRERARQLGVRHTWQQTAARTLEVYRRVARAATGA